MSQRNLTQFIAVASTAAAWLQLLLLALSCCCCFVSSQQMHVANPYKYQQLQYQMLQHQQQQYEYQKHIQQLYLQQQIKLQQQKQQQEQIQQQLLVEQEKAEMQKLLEQQEQEKLLQQQLQEQQQQQQQQQEQEEKLLQLRLLQQKQQQHATYSMPMTLPIQMQQSPQQYEQQQQQQQQHTIFPLSVSLTQQQQLPSQQQKDARIVSSTQEQQQPQQGQHFAQLSPAIPTQSQMLQTSASLIVDDECDEEEDSSEIVQKESTEYRINITPETIQAAPQPARRHPEVISLTDPQQESESDYNIASSIAPTAETIDFWRVSVVSVPAPTATALAATVPTAAAATVIAATAKATAPTSTATAAVRPTAIRRVTTTAAAVTSAASLTSTGAALTSSDSTAYDTTAPAFTSSAAALTAAATAATASLVAAAPRSTVDAATTRQRKDTRPKTTKRRRKPAAVREPLAALEKEQKLYELRDRQRQEFVADVSSPYRDKSYRRPYSQSKKQDDSHESSSNAANATVAVKNSVELKNILKKSGGMSLSEILQQKNLSLDDLLKGKQTALLALQTTSATAQLQDATPVRKKKPQRRIVPTAYTPTSSTTFGASAETFNSGESESSEQRIYGKNKLKFPALQRLKLFGTSSRGAAAHSGEAATAKRRDANTTMARSTSTTTTTTTTTTKRVPIYRKRQQLLQRTTLKPLGGLLKASTSTAQTVTKAPVKILPTAVESRDIADEEFDETAEAEEETMPSTFSSSIISSSTTTTTTTTAAPIPTKSSTTSSSRRISSSSVTTAATSTETRTQANVITRTQTNAAVQTPTNTKSRTQTKYALDITNPETNSIEHDDDTPPSGKSTESGETAVTYADDDLEDFFEEATTKRSVNNSAISSSTTFPDSLVERLTPRSDRYPVKPTSDYENLPYVDPVDDRTDLLELIEDRRSGNRLFKVLEQRNMTLEELIEHRKRGSSQLHLAMVVQNRSRFFPDKKVILRDNMDIVTAFENFPHFNLMNLKSVKPDEIKTDSQGSSYFTSIIDIEPTDEIYRDGNKDAGGTSSSVGKSNSESDSVKGPSYAQLQRTEKSLGFLPPWKTLALASSSVRTANNQNPAFYLPQPKLLLDTEMENNDSQEFLREDNELLLNNDASLSAEQIPARHIAGAAGAVDTAEAIENEVARAHDLLDLELSGHGFKRSPTAAAASMANQKHGHSIYGNMPAGIRSAIVASAAIVLTSLATFMVIFVVCRWKQHRKRKTNYMKTYNAMKSKLPMIATTTTSRQSTLHRHHIEDSSMVQSSGVQQSQSQQQQQQQQLHQPNARLFRSSSSHSLGGGMGVTLCSSRLSSSGSGRLGSGGIGTALTGSTTSLALSLQSAHYISNTKLNTMDPNSPEVQEYLFDALRKSF